MRTRRRHLCPARPGEFLPSAGPGRKRRAFRSARQSRFEKTAFTLVEIMIVVVIIGLLAAIAIPAFQRSRERSQASRFTNDFHQYDAAFQRYAMEFGQVPATSAAAGVIPTGMAGYLPASYTQASPMGGNYVWSGPSGYVVLVNSSATDTVMQLVDAALDDGNLTTGSFIKIGGTAYGLHIQ
jgi:prepilin-type N-terminal cleavage/methylation domain-containing protein